jgi:hypothetical protein|mmetsp:Transcript_14137/g.44215  ORF Transcript_14137/g.44215 Transcript_14137/m.44215 type:complete len:88 (-) Transcript_14137:40-303(-)|eukprot:CAMPEP_0119175600 /NCGR_PEP_ID=MMETSP1315-20130426/42741_1 /TAXON_ID=676789 /ORGANISM="Prasinoderma singularis, Strain RCC927" /LENGTH=87 /DNA_ID=CAMNT_0007169677 /DNA_START=154 /DNA_END=417 /DNA_ORIENTATION=-
MGFQRRRRNKADAAGEEPAPRFQDPEAPRPGYDRQRAAFGAMAVHKARRESSRRRAERQVAMLYVITALGTIVLFGAVVAYLLGHYG